MGFDTAHREWKPHTSGLKENASFSKTELNITDPHSRPV